MDKKSQPETNSSTQKTYSELIQALLKKNQNNKQKDLLRKLLKINSEKKAKSSSSN